MSLGVKTRSILSVWECVHIWGVSLLLTPATGRDIIVLVTALTTTLGKFSV